MTVHILAAVAEHEREAISERTKAALGAAKARGKRLGTPDPKGEVDPILPIRAFFDIGSGAKADAMAIWIVQWVGLEIRVLDYIEEKDRDTRRTDRTALALAKLIC